jgi:hypothetical protein
MKDALSKITGFISGLTGVVLNLVALGILVEVVYGSGIFGMGIIGNVVKIINSLGASGFTGLVALLVLTCLYSGKKSG